MKLDAECMRLGELLQEEEDNHEKICCKLRSPSIKFLFGEERCNTIHKNLYELYRKRRDLSDEYYEKYIENVKNVRLKNDIRVVFNRVIKKDCLNDVLKFL